MLELAQNFIILLIAFIAILTSILYIREYNRNLRPTQLSDKLLEQTQNKTFQIIHQAIKKAQSILGVAELQGLKIIAASKVSSGKLDSEFEEKLSQSLQSSETILSNEVQAAQKVLTEAEQGFLKYLQDLKTHTTNLEAQTQQQTISRMNQLFGNFETRLTDFLVKTESSTTQSIQLELRSVRQLIETYKNEQFALIDENIIAMMEQTLASVLGKKLSLKDQLDLVYEALEKAKIDKFIV